MSNIAAFLRNAFPPGPLANALENPNALYTRSGMTVFHFLVAQDNLGPKEALQLIGAGALVNVRDEEGNCPLSAAVANRDLPLVRALLQSGADVEKYEATMGRSLLAFFHEARQGLVFFNGAVRMNSECEMLSCLLAAGACPDGISGGKPPLISAIRSKNYEAMTLLLHHGADPVFSFTSPGSPPLTPLMAAMMEKDIALADVFFAHSPDVINLPVNRYQLPALHWAIIERMPYEIIGALLRHGADPLQKSVHGETGYQLAARMYGEENSITARLKLAESAALREREMHGKKTIDAPRRHP